MLAPCAFFCVVHVIGSLIVGLVVLSTYNIISLARASVPTLSGLRCLLCQVLRGWHSCQSLGFVSEYTGALACVAVWVGLTFELALSDFVIFHPVPVVISMSDESFYFYRVQEYYSRVREF